MAAKGLFFIGPPTGSMNRIPTGIIIGASADFAYSGYRFILQTGGDVFAELEVAANMIDIQDEYLLIRLLLGVDRNIDAVVSGVFSDGNVQLACTWILDIEHGRFLTYAFNEGIA